MDEAPFIGTIKGLGEAYFGVDALGNELSTFDRFTTGVGAIPGVGVIKKAAAGFGALGTVLRKNGDHVDNLAVPKGGYAGDFQSKNTIQKSGMFNTEGQARQLAREKVGANPVDIGDNKLRSIDGKWQYRSKPVDTTQNHVHLERLDPRTGEVLENWHLNWPQGASR